MDNQKQLVRMVVFAIMVLSVLDAATAFTTPTSTLSRALLANHVKVAFPKADVKSCHSKLSMSDVVTVDTSETNDDEPLFEPLGVGIRRDYSARLPLYKSDITDGLNVQVRDGDCDNIHIISGTL